jgi:O-antigen/teichoic acid export membrane protein
MVSESHFKKESVRHLFLQAVVFTVIACGGISMLYFVYASEIITVFYGVEYAPAADILRWYGFAMIPIALVLVAEQFLIAKGKILFAWLFICIAPVQFFAVSRWHSEIWMVILIMGLSGITLCAIGYGIMLRILIGKQVVKDA